MSAVRVVIGVELAALVACLAMPAVRESSIRGKAATAARDMREVCTAAATARAKDGTWPEGGTPGKVPASLQPYLPSHVAFDREQYQRNWDHWRLSDSADSYAKTTEFASVSVITSDPRLLSLITEQLGNQRTHFTLGNQTILMVSSSADA